jgi:hypothetical protein
MRKIASTHLMLLGGAALLAACSDGATAPTPVGRPSASLGVIAGAFSQACGLAPQRASAPGIDAPIAAGRPGQSLPTVVVTGTFPNSGIPFNVLSQMQFPMSAHSTAADCLNDMYARYHTDTLLNVMEVPPPPMPDGVDAEWWGGLSPREKLVALARAQEMFDAMPGRYASVGDALNRGIRMLVEPARRLAKLHTMDVMTAGLQAELFFGGVYGCELYRSFVRDQFWMFSNERTVQFVGDLVTAYAEDTYQSAPLRGLVTARNGVMGASLAALNAHTPCGLLVQQHTGGRIVVEDPYARRPGGGGGGYTPPSQDPDGLPPGWHPYRRAVP